MVVGGFEMLWGPPSECSPELSCVRCRGNTAVVDLFDDGLPSFCGSCAALVDANYEARQEQLQERVGK